jgi:DNA-binding GntR family transcriptional regulator
LPRASAAAPAYERIARTLRLRIERGKIEPGASLPSEADLCREFHVARGTVRQALEELERAGLIEVVPAKGRFVKTTSGPARSPADQAHQVAATLRAELASAEYADGDRFASEKELSDRFGVTRYVARQALAELEAAGLVESVHARGRFVRRTFAS